MWADERVVYSAVPKVAAKAAKMAGAMVVRKGGLKVAVWVLVRADSSVVAKDMTRADLLEY